MAIMQHNEGNVFFVENKIEFSLLFCLPTMKMEPTNQGAWYLETTSNRMTGKKNLVVELNESLKVSITFGSGST